MKIRFDAEARILQELRDEADAAPARIKSGLSAYGVAKAAPVKGLHEVTPEHMEAMHQVPPLVMLSWG